MTTFDGARGVDNIITLVRSATDAERAYGLTWYAEAAEWIADMAAVTHHTERTVAGVVAALSPRTSWPDNLRKATEILAGREAWGLTRSLDKARAIQAGADPDEVLTGPKERAFFATLADPHGTSAVVVDAHSLDAAVGSVGTDATRKRILERKGGYEAVADAYRAAAHILGLAPHATQAIAWAAWRNRYGRFAFQRVNTEDEAPGADPGAPSGDDTEPRTDPATYPDDTEPRTDPATYPDRREEP